MKCEFRYVLELVLKFNVFCPPKSAGPPQVLVQSSHAIQKVPLWADPGVIKVPFLGRNGDVSHKAPTDTQKKSELTCCRVRSG
eukprot:2503771-Amphidinium_carterae.1